MRVDHAYPTGDGGGVRRDDGKNRLDLLPWDALEALGHVYTLGAKKYAPRNWERGMAWSRIVGSMLRHLMARLVRGEACDPESGQLHTAHLAWNALTLLTYELRGVGDDDVTLTVGSNNEVGPVRLHP